MGHGRGNPFSLTSTVTQGIVSATGRKVDNSNLCQLHPDRRGHQPGNSGGALVDPTKRLSGINTMIVTRSGGFMGIGMAIPIRHGQKGHGRHHLPRESHPRVAGRADPGRQRGHAQFPGAGERKGVLIGDVFKEPARRQGGGSSAATWCCPSNSRPVTNSNELRNTVATLSPGKKFPVVVFRGGKETTLSVMLVERDEGKINNLSSGGGASSSGEGAADEMKKWGDPGLGPDRGAQAAVFRRRRRKRRGGHLREPGPRKRLRKAYRRATLSRKSTKPP